MPFEESPKTDKRERILVAAKTVFAEKGFANATIAGIAARADIGKGTVYEYYKSKEELFFAVFEWFIAQDAATAKIDISVLGLSVSERMIALSENVIGQWAELKDEFTLIMEFWAASTSGQSRDRFREAFRKLYGHYRGIIVALLQEGMDRGEYRQNLVPESIAAAMVGAWDAMFLQAWFDDDFDIYPVSRDFMQVMLRGLQAEKN